MKHGIKLAEAQRDELDRHRLRATSADVFRKWGIPLTQPATTCSVRGHGELSANGDGVRGPLRDGRGLSSVSERASLAGWLLVSALRRSRGMDDGPGALAGSVERGRS